MVSFHGCTVPRGWSRQYPNLLTMERYICTLYLLLYFLFVSVVTYFDDIYLSSFFGVINTLFSNPQPLFLSVRGAEYYKTKLRSPSASDHVIYTMTRNVVGPMDYTPLTFDAAYSLHKIKYAHSLALAVVFESGVVALADRADFSMNHGFRKLFSQYPFLRDFLAVLPTAWDDTVFLGGSPESHVVLARKKGGQWWVAGISSQKPSKGETSIVIDWSFLQEREGGGERGGEGRGDEKRVPYYRYWKISKGLNDTSLEETLDTRLLAGSEEIHLTASDGFVIQVSPLPLGSPPSFIEERSQRKEREHPTSGKDDIHSQTQQHPQQHDMASSGLVPSGTESTAAGIVFLLACPVLLCIFWKSRASILRTLGPLTKRGRRNASK